MPLLIDGHNLISALPDLELDDPHDEAKLVHKLRSYCGRTGQRCVVVFDGGVPGGWARELSSGPVRVIFAAAHRTDADRLIVGRIRRASSPGELTVVSSDQAVRAAAQARGMRVLSSAQFAARMAEAAAQVAGADRADDVRLSPEEVAAWMELFERRRGRRKPD